MMIPMLRTVVRNLVTGPATRLTPRDPVPAGRGQIDVEINQCIFCGLCQRKCPADALLVNRSERSWTLDPYRCIICGLCAEACPKKCIHVDNHSRLSQAGKEHLTRVSPPPVAVPADQAPAREWARVSADDADD